MCLASPPRYPLLQDEVSTLISDSRAAAGQAAPGLVNAGLLVFEAQVYLFKVVLPPGGWSGLWLEAWFLFVFPQVEHKRWFCDIGEDGFRWRRRERNTAQVAIDSHGSFSAVSHSLNHRALATGDIAAGVNAFNAGGQAAAFSLDGASFGGLDLAAGHERKVDSLADGGDDHIGIDFLGLFFVVDRREFTGLIIAGGAALQLEALDLAGAGENPLGAPAHVYFDAFFDSLLYFFVLGWHLVMAALEAGDGDIAGAEAFGAGGDVNSDAAAANDDNFFTNSRCRPWRSGR